MTSYFQKIVAKQKQDSNKLLIKNIILMTAFCIQRISSKYN